MDLAAASSGEDGFVTITLAAFLHCAAVTAVALVSRRVWVTCVAFAVVLVAAFAIGHWRYGFLDAAGAVMGLGIGLFLVAATQHRVGPSADGAPAPLWDRIRPDEPVEALHLPLLAGWLLAVAWTLLYVVVINM